MQRIATGGAPNYFGEQRFGREAGNLEQVLRAAQQLAEKRPTAERRRRERRGRDDAGFMLSAARSLIFNAILAERVAQGTWNRLAAGDVANLDGRGSVFAVDQRRRGARAALRRARRASHGAARWAGQSLAKARCWRSRTPSRRSIPRRWP